MPAYLTKLGVPPVRAHDAAVVTAVPVVAVYTTPKSYDASVAHEVTLRFKR